MVNQEVIHTLVLVARNRSTISYSQLDRCVPNVLSEPELLGDLLSELDRRGISVIYGADGEADGEIDCGEDEDADGFGLS